MIKQIEVGKVYRVEIEDCCVVGNFTSKLTDIGKFDDDGLPYSFEVFDTTKEDYYGTHLFFENGVYLEWMHGVDLTEEGE